MTESNGQIVTFAHLYAFLEYWCSAAITSIWHQCKALITILVDGQSPDVLAGLR